MQVTLCIPALFAAFSEIDSISIDQQALSALRKLLSRARQQEAATVDYEAWLYQRFTGQKCMLNEIPFAGLTAGFDGLDGVSGAWMRADPVYLYPDTHSLVMQDPSHLSLTMDEGDELADAIRPLLDDYDVVLHTTAPSRWYLKFLHAAPEMQCTPLFDALMKPANKLLPTGKDSRRWHTLFNEIQMVLNQSPVNQARVANGQQPVNSLWFWGLGQAPDKLSTDIVSCIGGGEYVESLCQLTDCRYQSLADGLAIPVEDGNVLILFDGLLHARRINNPQLWLSALKQLNEVIIEPLLAKLKHGDITKLLLVSDCNQQFECTPADIRAFWKRVRPLSTCMLS